MAAEQFKKKIQRFEPLHYFAVLVQVKSGPCEMCNAGRFRVHRTGADVIVKYV